MFGLRIFLGISVGLTTTLSAYAITLGQVQVQSAMNEPLRAKVPLSNLGVPASQVKAKLANASTYRRLGANPVNSGLQFSVQDAGGGKAYLLISSSQPVTDPFVDIVLDVNAGTSHTTHQVPVLLDPPRQPAVAAKQPAPDASFYTGREAPLIPTKGAPPPMTAAPNVNLPKVSTPPVVAAQPTPHKPLSPSDLDYGASSQAPVALTPQTRTASPSDYDATVVARQQLEAMRAKNEQTKAGVKQPKKAQSAQQASKKPVRTSKKPASSSRTQYTVVKNDTLWGIASKLSSQGNISIYQAMNSIQALNQDAFIRGDANMIRAGARITIPAYTEVQTLAREFKSTSQASSKQTVARSSSKSASSTTGKKGSGSAATQAKKAPSASGSKSANASKGASKQPTQAQLSIVAPTTSGGSAQGDSKGTSTSSLPAPIATQVQNARQATIIQRKKINQLNADLSGYSSKIKLQNAKLAELEKRLAELQAQSKSN